MPIINSTTRIAQPDSSGSNSGSGGRTDIEQLLVIRLTGHEPSLRLHIPEGDVATCTIGKRKWI